MVNTVVWHRQGFFIDKLLLVGPQRMFEIIASVDIERCLLKHSFAALDLITPEFKSRRILYDIDFNYNSFLFQTYGYDVM